MSSSFHHPFDDWADIYDQVYAYLVDDIPFYAMHAQQTGGPVLELGCGTGRVSLAAAALGLDVVGVDISPRMVAMAQRKASVAGLSRRARFHVDDLRTVRLGRQFPLVVFPFRSFQSMLTVEDQRAALATAAAHLQPSGRLILDVFAPDLRTLAADEQSPFHVQDVPQEASRHTMVVWGQNRVDPVRQINDTRLIIEELDPEGTVLRRMYRDFQVRYTFRYEMEHLLRLSGFEVEAVYGDFDGGPITDASDDHVWVARLAG